MEASQRGLLFTSKEIDILPGDFPCSEAHELNHDDLTPEQWLSLGRCTKQATPSALCQERETDRAEIADSTKRQALIKNYAWLYLASIKKNLEEKLLKAGAKTSRDPCVEEAVLQDLGTLWASIVGKAHNEDKRQARIGIFSDIPQEETTIDYINVPFTLTFTKFKSQVAGLGLVRYLTKENHPDFAETPFLDDSIVYHHPYPTAFGPSDVSFPTEIYPITRDYEAEGAGWYAHVIPLEKPTMVNLHHDWRPINTEADWQSLLGLLKKSPALKVFMRHKSVEDRMDFIKRHREREELEIARTGGCYTNIFLNRHMETLYPKDKMEGMKQFRNPARGKEYADNSFLKFPLILINA